MEKNASFQKGASDIWINKWAERFLWCLHPIKNLRIHSFKELTHYRRAFTCLWIEGKHLRIICVFLVLDIFISWNSEGCTQKADIMRLVGVKNHEIKLVFCTFVVHKRHYMLYICLACDLPSHRIRWHHNRNFNNKKFVRIIGYSIPRYFSWFRNDYWFSHSLPAHLSLVPKQFVLLLVRINCS